MDLTWAKYANMGLSFFLELSLLGAFAWWGIQTGEGTAPKILYGAGAPLLAAVFWGLFMAPRATLHVPDPGYRLIKVALFGLAALALADGGHSTLAWALGGVAAVNILLDLLLR